MNQSGLKLLCILVIILSFSATPFAQFPRQEIKPTFDVYGGYSGYNPGGKTNGVEFNHLNRGWSTAATVNFTRRYALFTEFGSYSNSSVGSAHTYLIGPRFTFHRGPFAPFAHIMMGAERMAPKGQATTLAFVEAFGGGLDVSLARQFSVRLFQADLVYATGHEPTQLNQNQFFGTRFSAGLIWNFGWKHRPTVATEKSTKPKPVTASTSAEASPAPAASEPAPSTPAAEAPANTNPPAQEAPATTTASATEAPAPSALSSETSAAPAPASENAAAPAPQVAVNEKPSLEKTPEIVAAAKPVEEKTVAETPAEKPSVSEKVAPEKPVVAKPEEGAHSPVQHAAALAFPYDQYPTLLSPKDKRNLDAVASRLKLEPDATAVIVGSGDRYAPKAAAQRAVNSKDYLVKKGIASERIKVFALPAPPTVRSKKPPVNTELVFVPAGATYEASPSTPVDELHVKPQHLHVAHPEWHEK